MRILITGVAGFIGSTLADRLIADGHSVIGIDNFETGLPGNVNEGVELYVDDIGSPRSNLGRDIDAIAHCAASYADRDNWERDTRTNVIGTAKLCKAAQAFGVERILYFQTALCYGHNPDPFPLSMHQAIAPDNSYAITKTAAEQFIQHSGIPYVSLRLANVYGPRNLSGPIPTFWKCITEGKTCIVSDTRRDYVYIDDLLEVAIPALLGKGSGVYHVSSGTDFQIADAFSAVAKAMGAENVQVEYAPRQPGDASSILLDPRATEDEFGWKASTPFADGIAKAVEWYSEHGVGQTFTHLAYAD